MAATNIKVQMASRHSVYAGTLKELREKRKQAEKNVEDGILFVNQNILLNDVLISISVAKTGN